LLLVKDVATRAASGEVINAIAAKLPEFWGGSADLAGSNNTSIKGGGSFFACFSRAINGANPYGRIIHFGIREHAMGSILNGITLHGLTRAFGGTFAVFSDYMRPAVRLSRFDESSATTFTSGHMIRSVLAKMDQLINQSNTSPRYARSRA